MRDSVGRCLSLQVGARQARDLNFRILENEAVRMAAKIGHFVMVALHKAYLRVKSPKSQGAIDHG